MYSVMMARSHELTHHDGKACTCKTKKGPTPKQLQLAYDLLEQVWRDPICQKCDDWKEEMQSLFGEP